MLFSWLLGDKEFNSVSELVDDSLIMLYLEQHDISKHLTLGRAKRDRVIKRRNVIKNKNKEDVIDLTQRRSVFAHNSSKSLETSDHVDGVYRELSSNDMEPVKVFVEDEKGTGKLIRQKAHSEKMDRKKFNLRIRKKDGNMAVNDRKSCPQEIVNLLSIYTTKPSSDDLTVNDRLSSHTKASSTENLTDIKPTGAIGQLLRNTLSIHSDENLAKHDDRTPVSRTCHNPPPPPSFSLSFIVFLFFLIFTSVTYFS